MSAMVEIEKRGDWVGIVLPEEILRELHAGVGDKIVLTAGVGDKIVLTAGPDGLQVSPAPPGSGDKMAVADAIMGEDRAILHVLAQ